MNKTTNNVIHLTPINYSITSSKFPKFVTNPYEIIHNSKNDILFYKRKVNNLVYLNSLNYYKVKLNSSFDPSIYNNFSGYNQLPFTAFFKTNFIDIPQCLKVNLSIRRDVNKSEILKFSNMIMRHGKQLNTLNLINKALNSLSYVNNNFKYFNYLNLLISNHSSNIFLSKNNILKNNLYNLNSTQNTKILLLENMVKLAPIFSFYIYKVKKKIFKNTRGKSGKYTFLWKYVPVYKRFKLIMFWITKEIKLKSSNTHANRLLLTFKDLLSNPTSLLAWKVKKFSHNYVFKNSKTTLGLNYRTTKK